MATTKCTACAVTKSKKLLLFFRPTVYPYHILDRGNRRRKASNCGIADTLGVAASRVEEWGHGETVHSPERNLGVNEPELLTSNMPRFKHTLRIDEAIYILLRQ